MTSTDDIEVAERMESVSSPERHVKASLSKLKQLDLQYHWSKKKQEISIDGDRWLCKIGEFPTTEDLTKYKIGYFFS